MGGTNMGLGKKRSKFGEFLDKNKIEQERVREESKLGRDTVSRICNTEDYPSGRTMKALLDAVRKLTGKDVKQDDFWPM
jgi:hypothetical protein